jgi:secondary thiamine-phosphate synthase enzyme
MLKGMNWTMVPWDRSATIVNEPCRPELFCPMTATTVTRHYQTVLDLNTRGKSLLRFTRQVQDAVRTAGIQTGLCTVFVRHTSASLIIQENADPDVLVDLENFMARLVPENYPYAHSTEGPDDMPAHAKASLMGTSVMLPIQNGRLAMGTWQGIYLNEHRNHGGPRKLIVTAMGLPRSS